MRKLFFLSSLFLFNIAIGQNGITVLNNFKCNCGDKDGLSAFFNEKGNSIGEGYCKGGKKIGKWIEFSDSTEYSFGKYEEGLRTGKWVTINKKIILEKGKYNKGELNGLWKYYYPTGKISKKGKYKNGMMIGSWQFYSVGGEKTLTEVYH